jgi:hypothetical protein
MSELASESMSLGLRSVTSDLGQAERSEGVR